MYKKNFHFLISTFLYSQFLSYIKVIQSFNKTTRIKYLKVYEKNIKFLKAEMVNHFMIFKIRKSLAE
jgi:hypothetical protein